MITTRATSRLPIIQRVASASATFLLLHLDRRLLGYRAHLFLQDGCVDGCLSETHGLDVGNGRVLLSFEDGIHLLERAPFGLDPVDSLSPD